MRLFQAALDTCLDSPFFASLSVHGLHFTVYAPSRNENFKRVTRQGRCFCLWGILKSEITPSTAGNSMTGSERPSPEPLLKKEASLAVGGGEKILEMLWKPQMP